MVCHLPTFEVFLTQPLLLAALPPVPAAPAPGQPLAAPGQAAGPPASSNVSERIPRDPQLDGIASRIVTADSSEAVKFKRSLSRPLRTRVLTSADEDDEDHCMPFGQAAIRPNFFGSLPARTWSLELKYYKYCRLRGQMTCDSICVNINVL